MNKKYDRLFEISKIVFEISICNVQYSIDNLSVVNSKKIVFKIRVQLFSVFTYYEQMN